MNNHIKTDIKELCTGCRVCKAVCPVKAIKFSFDDEGFSAPEIDIADTSEYPLPHNNLKRPTAMPETHDKFFEDLKKHGFGYISSKYGGYDFLRKLRYKIRDKIN